MKNKTLLLFVIFLCFIIYSTEYTFGQISFDHRLLIKEIQNSGDKVFGECLEKYNSYLKDHPEDILIQIEKCKFLQSAQYDEEMEVNPNQEEFDSCFAALIRKYPKNPEVILFRIENTWGDELKEIFTTTEQQITENPDDWSKANLSKLYLKISDQFYIDSDYNNAYSYIQKAIENDEKLKTSLLHAQILKELNRSDEALDVLTSDNDTIGETYQLVQKANLLLELKDYSSAVDLFNLILQIDSSYNNNYELAQSLEGIGKYDLSRKYLLRDTVNEWSKETAFKNLLNHDLKYQSGDTCIATYNKYRNIGYKMDPISLYRLKLFITDPFQPWKVRDLLGLFTLIGLIILIAFIPSIWILPVYFVGNYWNFINKNKSYKIYWGLKWFWILSFGYLVSALIACIFNPDFLYSQFNGSKYNSGVNQQMLGSVTLISILIFGALAFAALYKKDYKVLLSEEWGIKKSILIGIGILFAFKFVSNIYIHFGSVSLRMSIDELTTIPTIFFSSRQEIQALIASYGKIVGFILLCLYVPVYEEIVFRGVILDSCQKYINFNTANVFQAVLFGIAHLNLFLFPVFFAFGILTGIMRKKSQGLLPGIVFHSVNNTLSTLLIFLS